MHNDPKLVQAIVDFGKEVIEEQLTKRILELPYLYYGDKIDLSFSIKIDKKGLKYIAKAAGAVLPKYPLGDL